MKKTFLVILVFSISISICYSQINISDNKVKISAGGSIDIPTGQTYSIDGIPIGTTGNTGPTGAQGNTGATGEIGATGATGDNGTIGATGATGATGIDGSLNAWGLTGNSGTVAGTNFIGTTDSINLIIKVNNNQSGIIDVGNSNTSFGYKSNTTGAYNTANGYQSLSSNTEGINNAANGYQALFTNTTGSYNTAN
ncbi:MAG: hypothetical protein HGB12_15305, partial [Bacteroidetes bacterium]|nr:hypothetical protein [Bacteroidota bacterium]